LTYTESGIFINILCSLASNKTILNAIEEIEEQSCLKLGNLKDVGDYISHLAGIGNARYGAVNRRNTVTVPKSHFVILKLLDDILRGALFPLPDFSLQSLEEFDTKMLHVISEAYRVYSSAMAFIQPGFNFEGKLYFPNLET